MAMPWANHVKIDLNDAPPCQDCDVISAELITNYLTVDNLNNTRPFQDYDVISAELIAAVDMLVKHACCAAIILQGGLPHGRQPECPGRTASRSTT